MEENLYQFTEGQTFKTYESVTQHFQNFCQQNYQPFVVKSHNSKQIIYCCCHGIQRKSKCQGIRPNQRYLYKGCLAKINMYKNKENIWKVTKVCLDHNHTISEKEYMHHRRNYKLKGESLESVTNLILENEKDSTIAKILEKESRACVTRKDVQNIRYKMFPLCHDENETFLEIASQKLTIVGLELYHKSLKLLKVYKIHMSVKENGEVLENFKDGTNESYNTSPENCTCSFWKSHNAPCRHILFLRKEHQINTFPEECFHQQYKNKESEIKLEIYSDEEFVKNESGNQELLTDTEKFNMVFDEIKNLADLFLCHDTPLLLNYMQELKIVKNNIRNGLSLFHNAENSNEFENKQNQFDNIQDAVMEDTLDLQNVQHWKVKNEQNQFDNIQDTVTEDKLDLQNIHWKVVDTKN